VRRRIGSSAHTFNLVRFLPGLYGAGRAAYTGQYQKSALFAEIFSSADLADALL